MKRKSTGKKILLGVVAVVLVAAIGLGVWRFTDFGSAEPVYVFDFSNIGMTEYWADSQESYGPISTDEIQTIYLSDTQNVSQILVSQGDTVKKGDLLMTYDTTLTDLALERERLEVEKLKLQLEDAQKELNEIQNMKPMVIPVTPEPGEEPERNLGTALTGSYQISPNSAYDGSTQEQALVCWLGSTTPIDQNLLDALREKAQEYQQKNALTVTPTDPSEETVPPSETLSPEPAEASTETPSSEPTEPSAEAPSSEPTEPSAEAPTQPVIPQVTSFYVIFKVTQQDMSLGDTQVWQGMEVFWDPAAAASSFVLFDASGVADHTLTQPVEEETTPTIDYGSGYTAEQLAEMRSQQEKTIRDLQFQVRMAESAYKIKQAEASTGEVRSEIDGEVVSVLSPEEASAANQPLLKVSGGGGYYIKGTVSELERDSLAIGQEVTVNDWNNGMVYMGTIQSIGDYPDQDGYWNGMGNPNVSYYPFTVFVDGDADLQAGMYASMTFSSATSQNGIYLENPFLRTEQGRSYVYVQGEDGTLEQRFVTTGKSLWGSYTEILEGITAEDKIAFPYGKTVKPGAPTQDGEMSDLYGY